MASHAQTSGEPVVLTEQDLEYAQDLLDWSRGLDQDPLTFDQWQEKRES